MPTNVSYEYINAERDYLNAKTSAEKIIALQKLISENLRAQLKKRLAILKKDVLAAKKSGGKTETIIREGAAQAAIIGLPNSGKSTLLQELSGDKVKIAEYEFTTTKPEIRMMRFENIWLQGIELPAIYNGFIETNRQFTATIRQADFILITLDGSKDPQSDFDLIVREMKKANISLDANNSAIIYTRQVTKLKTKIPQLFYLDIEKILATVWSHSDKIRVQTKTRGKVAPKPIILKKGSDIKALTERVHRDLLVNFKHAKVWGLSAKFAGAQVGMNHILADSDVVEIFTK